MRRAPDIVPKSLPPLGLGVMTDSPAGLYFLQHLFIMGLGIGAGVLHLDPIRSSKEVIIVSTLF